jgi:16S rRNA processing protein RimM
MEPGGERLLELGKVVRPHGLTGEVVVALVTNRLERLAPGSVLSGRSRTAGGEAPDLSLTISASRPFQDRFLVRFEHVTDRAQAERLRDVVLLGEPVEDGDALFVHDLIGCELFDVAGVSHGRVVAVEANPASDLLVGEPGWLVPLRFVVNAADGKVVVDPPEGLFE